MIADAQTIWSTSMCINDVLEAEGIGVWVPIVWSDRPPSFWTWCSSGKPQTRVCQSYADYCGILRRLPYQLTVALLAVSDRHFNQHTAHHRLHLRRFSIVHRIIYGTRTYTTQLSRSSIPSPSIHLQLGCVLSQCSHESIVRASKSHSTRRH